MPRLSVVLVSLVLGATLALPAAAQWKWKTKDGKVQYSDLPPPAEVSDQDILQRPSSAQRRAGTSASKPTAATPVTSAARPASAPASSATPSGVDPKLEAERKKQELAEAAKKKAEDDKEAAAKADNCTRAKGYLKSLDDGQRIARTNAKGEREVLDDAARAAETSRTRAVISSDCK